MTMPMKLHKWKDIEAKRFTPEQIARSEKWVERELLEMDLRAVRELTGKTQEEVAKAAEMTQSELSRVERREDHRISTIRRIIEALGGELEVTAIFGDKRVRLRAV